MSLPRQAKVLHDRFRLAQTDRGYIILSITNQPRQVKLLPVRLRLAQADKRDITLSVSEFTTSSKSASDSLVTSAECWNEIH